MGTDSCHAEERFSSSSSHQTKQMYVQLCEAQIERYNWYLRIWTSSSKLACWMIIMQQEWHAKTSHFISLNPFFIENIALNFFLLYDDRYNTREYHIWHPWFPSLSKIQHTLGDDMMLWWTSYMIILWSSYYMMMIIWQKLQKKIW